MADSLSIGSLSLSGGASRLTGASSQLDTEAIVAAAYAAKRQPAVRLEQRISRNDARVAALGELRTLLGAVQDAVAGLRNPPGLLGAGENVFERKQAFLTGGGGLAPAELVGLSLENTAAAGNFTLEVLRLATAHKLAAQPLGAPGQTLADTWNGGTPFAGTLELGLAGGTSASIAVSGSMNAQDLRAAINAASAQTGIVANVITVSAGEQRLVLTAQETGKAIELADAGGETGGGTVAAGDIQAAQTARILVDGVAVERAGNRIADVMAGVTMDLYRAEPGAVVGVQVEPSLAAAKEQITAFVAAFNGLRDFVAAQGSVGSGGELAAGAVLFGDGTLRAIAQTLAAMVGGATPGLDAGRLGTLRDVGITLDAGGRLQIDDATLDARLLTRLDEVRGLFEFTATVASGDLGVYARSNALADLDFTVAISDPDDDGVPDAVAIDGIPAEFAGGMIRGVAGTPYEGLKLIWTGSGDASIEVGVSQGVADRLYNAIGQSLDLFDGPVQQAIDRLGETSTSYTRQIERIEERATRARERMIERLAAMEAALGLANTMLSQLRAQMDAMSGTN